MLSALAPEQKARLLVRAMRLAGDVPGHEFHGNQWTDGEAGQYFDTPKNFTLADAQYDIHTKLPLDTMVVAHVDLDLLFSGYGNDFRVREMSKAMKAGAKFPPLTLELKENGKLSVLDGQTRVAAFRESGIKGRVPAVIRLYDHGVEHALPKGAVIDKDRTASLRTPKTLAARTASTSLHVAAEKFERKFKVAIIYAFARGRAALHHDLLKKAIASRSNLGEIMAPAEHAVAAALREVLVPTLAEVLRAGGEVAAKSLHGLRTAELRTAKGPRDNAPDVNIRFTFNALDPRAVDWADRHAAELVTRVSETTRENINNTIAELLESGDWDSAYDDLLDAVGDGARATLIARHETMAAVSEGQREAWEQAVDEGLLTGDERRIWIITPDDKLCPICEGLEDKTADLNGMYEGDDGETYEGPPAHVACRCTEGLA